MSHINCILLKTSVVPSSDFVDFIHCASKICLGQEFAQAKTSKLWFGGGGECVL